MIKIDWSIAEDATWVKVTRAGFWFYRKFGMVWEVKSLVGYGSWVVSVYGDDFMLKGGTVDSPRYPRVKPIITYYSDGVLAKKILKESPLSVAFHFEAMQHASGRM